MSRYASIISAPVPQTEQEDSRQVANNAGGFSFALNDWQRLDRFLILGTEGGTFYTGEKKLTLDNVGVVKKLVKEDGVRVVNQIVAISKTGRAAKNDPALLALAVAAKQGNDETRRAAYQALPEVARIGTHLFHFADFIKALGGGWGRGTTRAFSQWYTEMPTEKLALQAIKYQQRDGWSHRDLLRKSHPTTHDDVRKTIFDWMCRGWESVGKLPHPVEDLAPIWAFERAKKAEKKELIRLITDYRLPHECVPNEMKKHPEVWSAMLPHMGLTAMIRNLGKMTSVGILEPLSSDAKIVRAALADEKKLRSQRVHPIQVLTAMKIYSNGKGDKGSLTWSPNQAITDALDGAFYKTFQNVEPTGKSHMLAIDVSGSMGYTQASNSVLSCREAAAAMALITANVETEHAFYGFSTSFRPLAISPKQRLDQVVKYMGDLPFSGTDCSLPMIFATKNRMKVDAFCVYTDNETFAGAMHPHKALQAYRKASGIDSKLVVFGMATNGFTIADPNDAGMLDVVGFDTAAPAAVADFIRG